MPGDVPPPPHGPLLSAQGLHKHFGGLRAVDGVDLAIPGSALWGIIGPNGAGKSTLFSLLAGALRPTAGRVLFEGRDVSRLPPYRRARLGLGRTFQLTRPLARMTVEENVALAVPHQIGERAWAALVAGPRVALQEAGIRDRVADTLGFFDLEPLRHDFAGSLSGGQRKLLELARVLVTDPRVVLLDEPLAGVNPALGGRILDKVDQLRHERGITFVLVEHDIEAVFRRCERILVMANGRILAQGTADDVRAHPGVVEAYLGGAG